MGLSVAGKASPKLDLFHLVEIYLGSRRENTLISPNQARAFAEI